MIGGLIALIHDEARRIWCHKWLAVFTALCIAGAGVAYVLRLPDVYDAWGQIFVNKETPVAAAAQGVSLVGQNYGSPYFVEKTLLNDKNLEAVVRRTNPAARTMSKAKLELAVAALRRQISVSPDQGDGFFEFHFRDSDPRRARDMAQLLLDQFVSRNLTRNEQELRQAGKFLDDQIASYEQMLADSQRKIADFRGRNPRFLRTEETVSPALAATASDLPAARAAYETALAQSGQAAAMAPSAAAQRVAALQAKLAGLRTQYMDQYPDVVATKRQLTDAMAEQAAEAANAPAAAQGAGPNPALEAARRRLEEAQRGANAASRPLVSPLMPPAQQSEWNELQRNDEVLRLNYQQLITRREAVRLSEAVYGADGSGKYQITRDPTVPVLPIGPKRTLDLAVVAAVAIAGALGAAYLQAAVKGIFVSPRELEQTFQLPVVGTVAWEPAWSTRRSRATRPTRLTELRVALGRGVAAITFRSLH